MQELQVALLALQELDEQIAKAESTLESFAPQLATVDEPVRKLERDIEEMRARLEELRAQARKLEKTAEQGRERLRVYEERLQRVRNPREEAAARTEMDLIRRATDAGENEALEVMEQARRTDLKLDELLRNLEKARAETAPQRVQLEEARSAAQQELAVLRDRRENQAVRLDKQSLRLYERVRGGRSRVALAPMTPEGACGNCFNVLPIQEQSEIIAGKTLKRCEACGVILYASDSA